MNKIFTILLLGFALSTNAQVISFQENFDAGMPGTWSQFRMDNNTPISTGWSATFAALISQNTAYMAFGKQLYSASVFTPPGAADRWIVSPRQYNLPANSFLVVDLGSNDNALLETVEIRVSRTDASGVAKFTNLIATSADLAPGLTTKIFSLAPFAGDSIHVAIRNVSNAKFLLSVDNFKIQTLPTNDLTYLGMNTHLVYNQDAQDVFKPVFRNTSKTALTNFNLNYSIDDAAATVTPITGINVAPYGVVSGITIPYTLAAAGTHSIRVWSSSPNGAPDDVVANDSSFKYTFHIAPSGNAKKELVAEYTGAWCGWCPDGAHALLAAELTSPDDMIGVAFHGGGTDAMRTTKADSICGAYATGYPSFDINRYNFFDDGETSVGFSRSNVTTHLFTAKELSAPASLVVKNFAYDTTSRVATFDFDTKFNAAYTGDFRYTVYIVEDSVKGAGSGWDQVNYYSDAGANASEFDPTVPGFPDLDLLPATVLGWAHRHVMREIATSAWGNKALYPATVVKDQVYSKSFTYTLPAGRNPKKTNAVVFVSAYNANSGFRQVFNSEKTPLFQAAKKWGVAISNNDKVNSAFLSSNVASTEVELTIDLASPSTLSVDLYNAIGEKVSNVRNGNFENGLTVMNLDLSNYSNGVYFIKISTQDGNAMENIRLVVQK
jgi:hypothetical protein